MRPEDMKEGILYCLNNKIGNPFYRQFVNNRLYDGNMKERYPAIRVHNWIEYFKAYPNITVLSVSTNPCSEIALDNPIPIKTQCCSNPNIIQNHALGETFHVCRTCKQEVNL